MLIQDVSNAVIPVPGYSKRKYEVMLTPPDEKAEKLIASALKDERYPRNLTNASYHFFQACAGTMMAYGESYYEIVYSMSAAKIPVAFRFVSIHPATVVSRRGRLWQHVPAEVVRERGIPSQNIELPIDSVLTFRLPPNVQRNHHFMMESLAFSSVNFMPEFTMTNMRSETNIPFDLKSFSQNRKMALARATRDIGWSGRLLFREEILEYYFFYRHLIFEKFKCVMRDMIVNTLNIGINKAGALIGFDGQLEIHGLPTLTEIEQSLARLRAGDKSFDEVMKRYIYS
jgi:hypothetical protein